MGGEGRRSGTGQRPGSSRAGRGGAGQEGGVERGGRGERDIRQIGRQADRLTER